MFFLKKLFKISFYIKYIYYEYDVSDFIKELFNSKIVTKIKLRSNFQEFDVSNKFSSYHSKEIKIENVSEGFYKNNSITYKEIKNLTYVFDDFYLVLYQQIFYY